jgi:DnaK suppressor protein
MNATVTKTAKKTAPAKTASKSAAAPAKAKPAARKSSAAPIGKTLAAAVKKTPKSAQAAAPAATKAARTSGSPAAKAAPAAVKKVTPVSAAKSAAVAVATKKAPAAPPAKAPVKRSAASAPVAPKAAKKGDNEGAKIVRPKESGTNSHAVKSNASMSANNAADVFVDKIQKTVVSKVSEVATKTTKPTSAVPTDGTLLTEAQILKMGEKDYMSAAQLAFFKNRLQQLEKDLLRNAGETTEHLRETVLVPDPADRATIEEEHALELRTRDRERKLLKKVQQSIHSIDAGDYGWCEETGEPIGVPRLLARPTATLSLEAQQRREMKQKLYGD